MVSYTSEDFATEEEVRTVFYRSCYLCNCIRKDGPHPTKSCFQVWHDDWDGGGNIPFVHQNKRLQFRQPGGKRKKRRQSSDAQEEEGEDEE
ncbi:hypothetical protein BBJ28_00002037 [Nothophytophthora sp. Chile5]|nr:hypothetical protein BBJ28_00002037 [Nothophytophthora sp. Chile5]